LELAEAAVELEGTDAAEGVVEGADTGAVVETGRGETRVE